MAFSDASEQVFQENRRSFYDAIRRFVLAPSAYAFDGPRSEYRDLPDGGKIGVSTFVKSDGDQNVLDAYYEAVGDLRAEGYLRIERGEAWLERRPARSDRTVDAPEDHRSQGRDFEEVALDGYPQTCMVENVREELRHFVGRGDFPGALVSFSRTVHVNAEIWAFTHSAMPWAEGLEDKLRDRKGVFGSLRECGMVPAHRSEQISVRFPYDEERKLLHIDEELWRLPVIVAEGEIFDSSGTRIEKYVNVMRADRYIISSETGIE
jgi:DNA-binding GntR family transcriptional regulator